MVRCSAGSSIVAARRAVLLGRRVGVARRCCSSIALLPAGAPLVVLVALAAGIGFATPPVGACVRTLLRDPRAFAVEASAVELSLGLRAAARARARARCSRPAPRWRARARVLLAGDRRLRRAPRLPRLAPGGRSRAARAAARCARRRCGRSSLVHAARVGAIFGAVEIGVDRGEREALGATAAAGPLLGVWGVRLAAGGGAVARAAAAGGRRAARAPLLARCSTRSRPRSRLVGRVPATSYALAAVLFLAGAAIAPTYATVYSLVERAAPAGTVTEAFAWLATAVAVGAAVGAAAAGAIAEHAGPAAVFVLAGGAGACALVGDADALGYRGRVPDVLIDADTIRSPELRHEIPAAVVDPFLYGERDGVAFAAVSPLDAPTIAAARPDLRQLDIFADLGLNDLIAQRGEPRRRAARDPRPRLPARWASRAPRCRRPSRSRPPSACAPRGIELYVDRELFATRRRNKTAAELARHPPRDRGRRGRAARRGCRAARRRDRTTASSTSTASR